MGAIAEALVATAIGIAVALPAVALYNYFQRRVANILCVAEALIHLIVAYLVDESDPATAEPSIDSTVSDLHSDIEESTGQLAQGYPQKAS